MCQVQLVLSQELVLMDLLEGVYCILILRSGTYI